MNNWQNCLHWFSTTNTICSACRSTEVIVFYYWPNIDQRLRLYNKVNNTTSRLHLKRFLYFSNWVPAPSHQPWQRLWLSARDSPLQAENHKLATAVHQIVRGWEDHKADLCPLTEVTPYFSFFLLKPVSSKPPNFEQCYPGSLHFGGISITIMTSNAPLNVKVQRERSREPDKASW